MVQILNEMAYNRDDAILFCFGKGKQFINHFHKIYCEPNSLDVSHWVGDEMQTWVNDINKVILKQSKRHISNVDKIDWFYTAGSSPEEYMHNPEPNDDELELYDKFVMLVLSNGSVKDSLVKLGIIEDF